MLQIFQISHLDGFWENIFAKNIYYLTLLFFFWVAIYTSSRLGKIEKLDNLTGVRNLTNSMSVVRLLSDEWRIYLGVVNLN